MQQKKITLPDGPRGPGEQGLLRDQVRKGEGELKEHDVSKLDTIYANQRKE